MSNPLTLGVDPNSDEITEIKDFSELEGLAGFVHSRFQRAETARQQDESRWKRAYVNNKSEARRTSLTGVPTANAGVPQMRASERSRVTIKITKVKVLAGFGHISDILFGTSRFPMEVEATSEPEGISKKAHLNINGEPEKPEFDEPFGFEGDNREIPPGGIEAGLKLGGLKEKYEGANLIEGEGVLGEPTIRPADEAAMNMGSIIRDQLTDTEAVKEIRKSLYECVMLGSGCIKGPFTHQKTVHQWAGIDQDSEEFKENGGKKRKYSPFTKKMPKLEHRSIWSIYHDPGGTSSADIEWLVDRHRLSAEGMRQLAKQPGFNKEAIVRCIDSHSQNYVSKHWENVIYDVQNSSFVDRFEVLEYWGFVDTELALAAGLDVPKDKTDSIQVNVWVCANEILKVIVNPFTPNRLPYHIFPYEVDIYRVFGKGIPENMEDSQMLMNGHLRMAIDNLALAGNVILEIDESSLVSGQSLELYPGKVFKRKAGVRGNAITAVKFNNTAPENIQMFELARRIADEETGIPSVMHGQTGVSGTGRTSSGLSMIMGAANISIKTVIKNLDDYLIKPLGEAYFQWNMQFNENDIEIVGDLEIKPKATAAMLKKEVLSQRITSWLGIAANPVFAPWTKIPRLLGELAKSLDMDPEDIVNNPEQAAVMAEILRGLLNAQGVSQESPGPGQEQASVGSVGGLPPGTSQNDASGVGGGNINPGTPSGPGESQFTGNAP